MNLIHFICIRFMRFNEGRKGRFIISLRLSHIIQIYSSEPPFNAHPCNFSSLVSEIFFFKSRIMHCIKIVIRIVIISVQVPGWLLSMIENAVEYTRPWPYKENEAAPSRQNAYYVRTRDLSFPNDSIHLG